MKNIKSFNLIKNKKCFSIFFTFFLFFFTNNTTFADVNITIRDGVKNIYQGSIPLPVGSEVEINDNTSTPRRVNSQSLIYLLNQADILSDNFSISNLEYFPSYGSLYLKCITSTSSGEKCENPPSPDGWQYTVDGQYPGVGMDQKIIKDGETIYLYFGNRYKTTLNASSITESETLTVTAEEYDYENNLWNKRSGVTVGVTQPNPDDPWTPIEIFTKETNENGQAMLYPLSRGEYNIGIKEDFYYPTEPLSVKEQTVSSGGGGSKRITSTTKSITSLKKETDENTKKENNTEKTEITGFNKEKAMDYITSQQNEDGSFGEDMYTDWSALALASTEKSSEEKNKLFQYLATHSFSGTSLTDYERHTMALMALGLNPYGTAGEDYVSRILKEFDGMQFGDSDSFSDDVFAVIILQNLGFDKTSKYLERPLLSILQKQSKDGSWVGSVDMTASSISALSFFSEYPFVHLAIDRAKGFLKHSQKEDGGFGNPSSTSWAIEGILSLKENPEDWKHLSTNKTPLNYLINEQVEDGAMKTEDGKEEEYKKSRLWEVSYVLTASSLKKWNEIMHKFSKK